MSEDDVIEGTALAVHIEPQTQWVPKLVITREEKLAQLEERKQFMRDVLRPGIHYSTIPGDDKPSLRKPGAEQLLNAYGFGAETGNEEPPVKDYMGIDHGGETFIEYERYAKVYRQTGPTVDDRVIIAQFGATCNSWETKYRYRYATLRCPECDKETLFQSKPRTPEEEDQPQPFFCWKKKGGCGVNLRSDDKRVTSQKPGKVPNENIADLTNTIKKMADKRALIAAVLVATGVSDIFTQDMEERPAPKTPTPPKPPREEDTPELRNTARKAVHALANELGININDPDSIYRQILRDDFHATTSNALGLKDMRQFYNALRAWGDTRK